MSKLYIVSTPIGNLEDITLRALRILKEVDFVICEDTRHTLQLLNHFQIKKPLISYHQHSRLQKIGWIIDLLKQDKNLALVSDAGTPGISDPGNVLVSKVVSELGDKVQVIPIPGACALTTLASVAGLPTDKFLFLGFLPNKKGRQSLFELIKNSEQTVIFYESPYRILKTLEALAAILEPARLLVIGRELTKMFETIYRGTAEQVLEKVKVGQVKGEFVVLVVGKRKHE
jgi:16S rRNA (cytidine1402-2'-O)-methyltransferase